MADENKKKVMIVEDDEFLRSLTAKRLEKEGYAVVVAVDGESAVGIAEAETPGIILLDLLLPGLSGFEVLGKLKENATTKDTPVIVFSNLGQREDVEKAKGLGASEFLIKANYTLDDVISKVNSMLA
ncbi:MAG TPA: response regulator [Candidatus Paceibacterota bacterium]|nr:response regulator [Candidatus Paceibacterota bacterium]